MKSSGCRMLLGFGLMVSSAVSFAAQYTWDFSSYNGTYSQITMSGGLTVKAYRTSNSNGTGTLDSTSMQIRADGSWGIGVLSPDETAWPDTYTLDNTSRDEVLVFDSGQDNFDWTSLKIGYVYTGSGADPSPVLTYLAANANPASTLDYGTLIGGGKELSIAGGGTKTLAEKNTGRYLMVSGDLGATSTSGFDKFKISTIKGQTPEPQSLALLGIGVLAMVGLSRRSRKMVYA